MADKGDINVQVLVGHMQAMERRLSDRIDHVQADIKRVENNLNRVEGKVDLSLVQTSNQDIRLDDLEVIEIPKLKKAVGMR